MRAQPLGLVQPVAYELLGVLLALFQGRFALVGGLLPLRRGDGPVLDARMGAQASVVQEGPQVLQRQLEADVPVELPVDRVARIALLGGPDRARGVRVAPEDRHFVRAGHRGVHPVARAPVGVQQAVRLQEGVVQVLLAQELLHPRIVAALREPEAPRVVPEVPDVGAHRHRHLGAHRVRNQAHGGQEAVAGAGGDQLQVAALHQAGQRRQEVAPILALEGLAAGAETLQVHAGQLGKPGVAPGAFDLALGQLQQAFQVGEVAGLQQRVAQHLRQAGGNRQGQAERHPVALQPLEDRQQRQVGLGNGLVEPVLLQEALGFRMAHERQVGVQHQGQVPADHSPTPALPTGCAGGWPRSSLPRKARRRPRGCPPGRATPTPPEPHR